MMPGSAELNAEIKEDGGADLDHRLIAEPLDYILAEHHRQRTLCQWVDRLAAESALDRRLARLVAQHIARDMTLHIIDEEEDLFPLLRRRALPEDQIDKVLGMLSGEHATEGQLGREAVDGLLDALERGEGRLSEEFRHKLRAYAAGQRRHLAVENAVVMPIAERRLTRKDREGLARRMAARRGISLARPL